MFSVSKERMTGDLSQVEGFSETNDAHVCGKKMLYRFVRALYSSCSKYEHVQPLLRHMRIESGPSPRHTELREDEKGRQKRPNLLHSTFFEQLACNLLHFI